MIFDREEIILTIMALINLTIASLTPIFIYCIVQYPGFRSWIVRLIEDDDGVAHKQDAKDAVILFFAVMFSWLLIDLVLLELLFELKNGVALIGSVSLIVGGLFGISQIGKK